MPSRPRYPAELRHTFYNAETKTYFAHFDYDGKPTITGNFAWLDKHTIEFAQPTEIKIFYSKSWEQTLFAKPNE